MSMSFSYELNLNGLLKTDYSFLDVGKFLLTLTSENKAVFDVIVRAFGTKNVPTTGKIF
jgi:hypothetical protein